MTANIVPPGSAPQYETLAPMLPRNSISNHVAGNVATKNNTSATSNTLNMTTSLVMGNLVAADTAFRG